VSLCAAKDNLASGELARTIELARRLGVKGARIALPMCSGRWMEEPTALLSASETAEVRALVADDPFVTIVEEETGSFVRCNAVSSSVYVSPYGEVQPCNFIPMCFGDIRSEPLELILERMAWHASFADGCQSGCCPMQRADFVSGLRINLETDSQLTRVPPLPTVTLTSACNNGCDGCALPEHGTLVELDEVIARLDGLDNPYQAVLLVGGEPTLHPDLVAVVNAIRDRGWQPVIQTNGRVFTYERRARALVRAGARHYRMPFFAGEQDGFDARTGVAGSFEQTIAGLKNLLAAGAEVTVEIPEQPSARERDRLVELLVGLGASRVVHLPTPEPSMLPCSTGAPSWPAGCQVAHSTLWHEPPDFHSYDVVLYYPHDHSVEQRLQLPHGLLALAAPVVAEGLRVKIIDERVTPDWLAELERTLRRSPDCLCVGISCFLGPQIEAAFLAARAVRELDPDLPVVFGGAFPSLVSDELVRTGVADIVVRGEGEGAFTALVRSLQNRSSLDSVPGITFAEGTGVIRTERPPAIELDQAAPIPYQLLSMRRYRGFRAGVQWALYSSRGCPHACSFCAISKINHRRWRAMSAERVLTEIEQVVAMGARDVAFCEDNFFVDLRRCRAIAERVLARNLRITWGASCRVDDILRMEDADLDLLRQSGLRRLYVGAESGSDRVLELLNKKISHRDILAANRRLRDHGIVPEYIFMVGFPTETDEERQQTVALVEQLKEEHPDAWFWRLNHYVPYPGTPLYDTAIANGFVPPESLEGWATFGWHRSELSDLIPYQVAF